MTPMQAAGRRKQQICACARRSSKVCRFDQQKFNFRSADGASLHSCTIPPSLQLATCSGTAIILLVLLLFTNLSPLFALCSIPFFLVSLLCVRLLQQCIQGTLAPSPGTLHSTNLPQGSIARLIAHHGCHSVCSS